MAAHAKRRILRVNPAAELAVPLEINWKRGRQLVVVKKRVGALLRWLNLAAAVLVRGEVVRNVDPSRPPQKREEYENLEAKYWL